MGQTIYHDLYNLSKWVSQYLPLSGGIPLDREVSVAISQTKHVDGEYWTVVSKTGNGKTTLVKALVRAHLKKMPWLNLYIVDTKKQGDFSNRDGKRCNTYMPSP